LVDLSNEIAYTYGIISIDSSLVYSTKAIKLAEQINYIHGLGIAHSYVARASMQIGEMKIALEHYDKALEIFSNEPDSLYLLDTYRGMSYAASYTGNQLACLNYNRKALEIAKNLQDSLSLSIIYNNIASLYKKLDNYELSIHYFEKTLELEIKNKIPKDMAITYSNMGILKLDHEKFTEAAADYQKIKELLPKIENTYVLAYLNLSLANYFTAINELKLSKQYLAKSEELCHKDKFQHILARVYRQYGELYLKEKQYKRSIEYFNKEVSLSEEIGVYEEYPLLYRLKAEAHAQLGQHAKAYQSIQKAIVAIDSLKTKKVSNFLAEFEAQKAKDDINKQKLELALKKQQAENIAIKINNKYYIAVITIALLLLLIAMVSRFYFKSRQNNQKLKQQHQIIKKQKVLLEENIQKLELSESSLQKLNATKNKFFSIIAHDLKSPFTAIMGYNNVLALHYNKYNDDKGMEMIKHVGDAAKSTFSLLENLLTWAQSQSGFIEIHKEVHSLKNLV
jgi:tetratricopeptide (TPR) repeat protein